MSCRSQSTPYASTFAHMAGVRRIERSTRVSSGGLGGRPRGRFGSSGLSMRRTVAPIYRCTNIPCNPDFACYDKYMNTAKPTTPNPYAAQGSLSEAWQRGYDGRPLLAYPGSDYAKAYAEGKAARKSDDADGVMVDGGEQQ